MGEALGSNGFSKETGNGTPPSLPTTVCGVGVDVEPVHTFSNATSAFLTRNFTKKELEFCRHAPHQAASLAGRWAAKESVLKAISSAVQKRNAKGGKTSSSLQQSLWNDGSAPLRD